VYNRVEVTLTTHDAGGLSAKDAKLAASMDELAARFMHIASNFVPPA
jgi:4a-hydroxytetrahydrobiopterin dehydratase